jgi:hypothetical protein
LPCLASALRKKGRKGIRQRNKGRRVKECKGVKDRLRIYYNSLINNVLDGGASET